MADCSALSKAIQALEELGQLDLGLARQLKEAIKSASIQLKSPNPFDLNCEGDAALSPRLAQLADDLNRVGDSETRQYDEPNKPSSTEPPDVPNEQAPAVKPASKNVVIVTVGELLSAWEEESRLPEGATLELEAGGETRKSLEFVDALVEAKGGDKPKALRQLIAEVQLAVRSDKARVSDMSIEEFVVFALDARPTYPRGRPLEFSNCTLKEIEEKTPKLDTKSIDWIMSRTKNQKKLGYPPDTLAQFRTSRLGGRRLSPYFGIDKDGRRWRRPTHKTEKSAVYYLASDVEKCQRKVSN